MRLKLKNLWAPFVATIGLLIFFEIISSTLFPIVGIQNYRLPFHILIVLYLGFRLETAYLSVLVLLIQYIHSLFSIEGWALGTVAGILICMICAYLKELLDFSSKMSTIFLTFLFQSLWFFIQGVLLYLTMDDWGYVAEKFWRFLPESFVLSILSPFVFGILDFLWRSVGYNGSLEEEV